MTVAMKWIRVLLVGLGLVAIAAIAQRAGTEDVLRLLRASGLSLVVLIGLELAQLALEARAARALYPPCTSEALWSSTRAAYAAGQLLPGGRAVGEALRAARWGVPKDEAIRGAATLHALYVAGAAITLLAVAPWLEGSLRALALTAGGWNVLVALALWALPRALLKAGPAPLERARVGRAAAWLLSARAAHLVQAAFAVHAIGRAGGPTLEVLQLLSASAADAVPAQIGALEGIFSAFAEAWGATASEALALALLMRASRLSTMVALAVLARILAPRADGALGFE